MFDLFFRNKLTVFLFHKVPQVENLLTPSEISLKQFETTLGFAKEAFRILPLTDAVLALKAGNLPQRAACITFDDGYPDWLAGAVPVLQRGTYLPRSSSQRASSVACQCGMSAFCMRSLRPRIAPRESS
jgi:hypothetical protein